MRTGIAGDGKVTGHILTHLQSNVEGDIITLSVPTEDALAIASTDGYTFAGGTLSVSMLGGSPSFSFGGHTNNKSVAELKVTLKTVLSRRYNAETKILDLSNLTKEPELIEMKVKELSAHPSLFPVFMKICDDVFPTARNKLESVGGVLLGHNGLRRCGTVRSLASTFPGLKNLDLSNNKLTKLWDLQPFLKGFKQLEHVILNGNPLEENGPAFKQDLIRAFPKLQIIDGVPLSQQEIEAARNKKIPIPVRKGHIEESTTSIAADFVTKFFLGYDSDRKALVDYYYDNTSKFSLSVNTHALRDRNGPGTVLRPSDWDHYIKLSRNLLKISHLNARMNRSHNGREAISRMFEQLPATQHPSLESERGKWLIEFRTQPGVPDPSGQSPTGVNGLCVTIHGEFVETVHKKQRSFDRTFILGPGGVSGVKVVSDILVLRAYGGTRAFVPDEVPLTLEDEKQAMVMELARQTGLNLQYSIMCLEQNGGSLEAALANFQQVRANIPPEAFV
jgi:nuclear RNA export factor